MDNTDTGAITGSDAGGSKSKNAEDIVPESGVIDTSFNKNSFVVDNLTIKLGKRDSNDNAVSRSFSDLSTYEKYLWQSLKSYWVKGGLDLIAQSYGNKFSFSSTNVTSKTLYVIFIDEGRGGALATTYGGPENAKKCTNDLKLHINLYYYGDAYGKDGKVTNGEEHLDRTIAHELTHAVMRSNIDYFDKLPAFIKEGMAELTHGIDDSRSDSIETLAKNSSLLSKALSMSTDTVKISGVSSPSYSAGYIFLRYLAKQSAESAGLNFTNYTENTVLSGTSYEDTIKNIAGGMTIKAGAGNDSIYSSTDKNYTVKNAWGYVTIDAGAGNDTIHNDDPYVSINGGTGNDTINAVSSSYGYVTIHGGTGNDSIRNSQKFSKIYGDADADYIVNTDLGANVTIYGGAGNDSIRNTGNKSKVYGDADNDSIVNFGDNVTIYGGTGNDKISLYSGVKNNVIVYNSGDGNDTLQGISNSDTIKITGDKYEKVTLSSSSDVTLKVGTGSMILKNAKNVAFKIDGTLKPSSLNFANYTKNTVINGTTNNDTIKNYAGGVKIFGSSGSDSIYNDTNKNYTVKSAYGYVTIDGGAGKDTITNYDPNVSINGGADNDYIYSKSSNVTIRGGSGSDSITNYSKNSRIYGEDNNDTITNYAGGVTIQGGTGNDFIKSSTDKNYTVKSAYGYVTIDAGAGADSIDNNDSYVSINGGADNDKISVGSYNNVTVVGGTGNDTIYGNRSGYGVLYRYNSGDGNDIISAINNNDTISITGGKYQKVTLSSSSDVTLKVGTGSMILRNAKDKKYTVKGTLDGGNKISLTSGNDTYNSTVSNKMIYALAGNDKIKNTASKVTIYGGAGNDSIENRIGNVLIYGDNDNDSILNTSTNVTINGGAGADTIENHSASKGATIHGDSGNDLIKNNGSNIRIYGDSGSDKISIGSSASNVTVIGGADNDTIYSNGKGNVFQYASGDGKDFISGYTSKDTIKITSGSISKATVSGNNVVFTVGTGTITVKDGKDKAITVVDSSGKKTSATYPTLPAGLSVTSNNTKLTVNKNYASTAVDLSKYASTIKIVDASVLTKKIKISGGKNAMSIIGGSGADTLIGGAKADTLNGGAGNDTLTGGAGNDVFLYGTGKDVITDYTAGQDKIKILSGKISKTSYSGQNVIFTIGSGTLTVKNGKGKKITIVDANNNTTTKTYSGTSQTSGLLYEDDNFIDGETKLDAITEIQESNYLLGKNDTVTAEDELEQLHKYDFKFSGQN